MSKALVVDDDKKIRSIFRRLLSDEGYEVLEAGNGGEAAVVLVEDRNIDVVLLDIDMPLIDGVVLFDLIKLYVPSAKIIVTSVYPLEDQKRMILKADEYFDKAEGTQALLLKIRAVLHG